MIARRTQKKLSETSSAPIAKSNATTEGETHSVNETTHGGLLVRYDISVVNVIGFMVIFASIIASWTSIKGSVTLLEEWKTTHSTFHSEVDKTRAAQFARIDERLVGFDNKANTVSADSTQLNYRIAQLEKAYEALDVRLNRFNETYVSQLSEIRAQLNAIAVQLALIDSTLKRGSYNPPSSATPSGGR